MLRQVYARLGGLVLPLQAPGRPGMEAGLANLVEPGDTVIVGVSGTSAGGSPRSRDAHGARVRRGRGGLGRARPERRAARRARPASRRRLWRSCTERPRPGVEHPLAELGGRPCAAPTRC